MQPLSSLARETVIDRRQPAIRWNAIIAGSALALAIWMLLQLFGSGVALSMLGTRDLDRVHGYGIGTTTWSVLAPLVALFLGGMLAARLAGNHDRKIAGLHGMLVWAFAAFIGVAVVSAAIAAMSPDSMSMTLPSQLTVTAEDLRLRALATADSVGTAFLVTALALALGAIAAIGGALVSAHGMINARRRFDTLPGHTTAPYPVIKTDDVG